MYSIGLGEVLSVVSLIWLVVLSYLILQNRQFLRQLFPRNHERDIRNKFKEIIVIVSDFDKRQDELIKDFDKFRSDGLKHLQRISLLRYNPYGDTGGDQSFSVAMLDDHLDGFILTSLHSRAGTRVYTKKIKAGKSDLELSKEESQILEKVIK